MKIRTPKGEIQTSLFPCKKRDVKTRLLELNKLLIKEGYTTSWKLKNGVVIP